MSTKNTTCGAFFLNERQERKRGALNGKIPDDLFRRIS
jgi:hypothetical protein